jgi:hypothetical protein
MNASKITDSDIKAYLLGIVEGEAADEMDELVFVDEDIAARVGSAERDLIDDYLRNELSGESLHRFESYYLRSPLRQERIRLARSINRFVDDGVRVTDHPIRAETAREVKTGWLGDWWKVAIPAFAAAVLIAIAVPFLLQRTGQQQVSNANTEQNRNVAGDANQLALSNSAEEPSPMVSVTPSPSNGSNLNDKPTPAPKEVPQKSAPAVFAVTLMPLLRSSANSGQISIPSGTERVAITLKLEPTEYALVRVQLKNASGSVIWRGNARPSKPVGGYQSIPLSVPASLFKSGRYEITASGTGEDSEIVGDYFLNVVP